jgi:hypothetical protein
MGDLEHVTFRPGALAERLAAGPLSPGAMAKRDLGRYYDLLGDTFDAWYRDHLLQADGWPPVVAFASTRAWDTVPSPVALHAQFVSFVKSPMARAFDGVDLSVAATALIGVSAIQAYAILDRAEQEIATSPAPSPAVPTAGATSAAASAP